MSHFIMNIYDEVNKRLNINSCIKTDKHCLRYEEISKYFTNTNFENCFLIPNDLYNDVRSLIESEFRGESRTKLKNKFDVAIFITLIIYNDAFTGYDYDYEKCFLGGVQLSKEIFTSVVTTSNLYKVKKILVDNKIIEYKKYEKLNKFFSEKSKLAIKYLLNKKYSRCTKIICVENKYALKFISLLKNGFLYGTKKKSINDSYLPFNSDEKNIQYLYQKNMYFDEDQFDKILNKCYPNIDEIFNSNDKELKKSLLRVLNCHRSLNNHIFKSTESYGRIYMPFQYISSNFRKSIRIGNNEELVEIYDIHCCFVYLTSKIIMQKTDDINLIKECEKIIFNCDNDIYKDILKYNKLSYKIENRKKIKANVMKWLFSCRQDRYVAINNCNEIYYIDNYFKNLFPLFYSNVSFYKEDVFYKDENGKIKKERCSRLPFECFEYESDLMFNYVLPFLHKKYQDIPFISLHDGIFIPKRFITFEDEIKNDILNIINQK